MSNNDFGQIMVKISQVGETLWVKKLSNRDTSAVLLTYI